MTTDNPEYPEAESTLEAIFQARRDRRVMVRIPKSVRSTVAEALAFTIDVALSMTTTLASPSYFRSCLLCLVCHHAITIHQYL